MTEGPSRDRFRVRPYALTGGRVRSSADLALETMVRVAYGDTDVRHLTLERREIFERCSEALSIAEVSAYLKLPLGVARVLVGDMVVEGLLIRNDSPVPSGQRPDLQLLERVLDGLQAL